MKAAQITRFREPLAINTVPDPAPPEGGVVLRVLACGVCRSDWHAWVGAHSAARPGLILGHEYCGEVVAVGAGVTRWQPGDRVIAPFILACGGCPDCAAGNQTICDNQQVPGFSRDGAYAELIAVPFADANLTALPDTLSPDIAAGLGCRVTTAWHALTGRAALRAGEWLAVFGGGGIGVAALVLGRALGARVVVVDVVDDKLDFCLSLGADAVVNATKTDAVQAVRDITGGGADLSVEALGIDTTTVGAIRALRKMGRMVQIGLPAGEHAQMTIPMDVVYSGQLAIYGTRGMPSWRYPSLLSMIAGGQVDLTPLVTRTIPLSQASAELAAFDGPTPPGVAVITDFLN